MNFDELKTFAAKFNAAVYFSDVSLTVRMPQTKSQAKEGVNGDFKIIPFGNNPNEVAINIAYDFIKEWESYWRLKSQIKKKDIEKFIRHKIGTSPSWAIKTLLVIYSRQTDIEQKDEATEVNNSVGFTGFDAKLMTSFAKQYIRHFGNKYPNGDMSKTFDEKLFSKKQYEIVKRSMQKYWKQILAVSDEKKLLKQMAANLPAIQMRLAL
jgi:hypothetical protein